MLQVIQITLDTRIEYIEKILVTVKPQNPPERTSVQERKLVPKSPGANLGLSRSSSSRIA